MGMEVNLCLFPPQMRCQKITIIIYKLTKFFIFVSNFYISALFCPKMNKTENGKMTCTKGNKLGSLCKLKCNDGYTISPKDHQGNLCNNKSEWVGSTASCIGEHVGQL